MTLCVILGLISFFFKYIKKLLIYLLSLDPTVLREKLLVVRCYAILNFILLPISLYIFVVVNEFVFFLLDVVILLGIVNVENVIFRLVLLNQLKFAIILDLIESWRMFIVTTHLNLYLSPCLYRIVSAVCFRMAIRQVAPFSRILSIDNLVYGLLFPHILL